MSRAFDYSKWDRLAEADDAAAAAAAPPVRASGAPGEVDDVLMDRLRALKPQERDNFSHELDRVAALVKQAEAGEPFQGQGPDGGPGGAGAPVRSLQERVAAVSSSDRVSQGIASQTKVLQDRLAKLEAQRLEFDRQQHRLEQLASVGDAESVVRFFQEQGLGREDLQKMMGGSQADSQEVLEQNVTSQAATPAEVQAKEDNALGFAVSLSDALSEDPGPMDEEAAAAPPQPAAAAAPPPSRPRVETLYPEHQQRIKTLGDGTRAIVMQIVLPELQTAADVALDIAPRSFKLKAPLPTGDNGAGREYLLNAELELTVDQQSSRAKWSKKTRTLHVEIPVAGGRGCG